MKRSLLIHPGFGKTATTWLQRQVFPNLPHSLYLGKDPFASEAVQKAHDALFPPLYGTTDYRARNSSQFVSEYVAAIKEVLAKASTSIERVVLSDECIVDYSNFNAELNLNLLRRVSEALASEFDETRVLFTVRNQESYLSSYFAFDYENLKSRFRTFDEFMDYGYRHPREWVFGGIHYDTVFVDAVSQFGNGRVKFLPYEALVKDPAGFLGAVADFWGVPPESIVRYATAPKENVNKSKDGLNTVRGMNLPGSLILQAGSIYRRLGGANWQSSRFHALLKNYRDAAFGRWGRVKHIGVVQMGDEARRHVRSMYRESNQALAALIGADLKELGWPS